MSTTSDNKLIVLSSVLITLICFKFSSGEGKKFEIASNKNSIPLSFKAEPHKIGCNFIFVLLK